MDSRKLSLVCALTIGLGALSGCSANNEKSGSETPTPVVEPAMDLNNIKVDHPERFVLAKAVEFKAPAKLEVTGVVNPDIARAVPVVSLAAGRVVEIKARLGDAVKKGQVLLRVQSSDIAAAFSDYRKAVADEGLAAKQFERAKDLYDKGAISLNDMQVAQSAEEKAKVDVETALERLRVLGADKDHPAGIVDIKAPVSGVITDQQVTSAAGVQGLSGPNPFTISDLSYVWIVCDVYENDLDAVKVGEYADIRINAYPRRVVKGRIDNILPILDPAIRTAKVRLEVANPDRVMRVGMFATATFYGRQPQTRVAIPSSAVLHLHDRDWVYVPRGGGNFRRVAVVAGQMLSNNQQEIISGIEPGAEVVQSALVFQDTVEQ